ncbi:MAG TPA: hypothetical protein VED85_06255 [Burkholderiaceae bacterium]|nr:hypothetical protein [Burkholderiaceae bacterium]
MSKLKLLAQRRELVVLSAEMQRVAIKARLDRLQENPKRAIFSFALGLLGRPWVRAAAVVLLGDLLAKVVRRR